MGVAVPGRLLDEQGTYDKVVDLIREKGGIRLDVGAGNSQNPGFVTMDRRALPHIDIVHDLHEIPWPLPSECCQLAIMSHLVEHLIPWKVFDIIDELWRVMKPGGQLLIATPYAGTPRFWQDPSHTHGWTEKTPHYWDPQCHIIQSGGICTLFQVYTPLPWMIEDITWSSEGDLNVRMSKRPLPPED